MKCWQFLFTSVALFLGLQARAASSWFDQSHEALLPAKVDQKLLDYQDFPVFWWNFLVLEFPKGQEIPWAELREKCAHQLHGPDSLLRRSPCEGLQGSIQDLLKQWSSDFILRHPKPEPAQLESIFNQTLAKASLPMDRQLLDLLRIDPFNSLQEYQKIVLARVGLHFENHQGLFYDAGTNRVLIPVQLLQKPSETEKFSQFAEQSKNLCEGLKCQFLGGVGPHFSTWENESQVRKDVDIVSIVGWVVLAGFICFFVFSGRPRLLLLFPPLFLTMLIVGFLTYLIFGKIHGLTLSFGPSIVGMAIDYGLHGAFAEKHEKGIWKANFFGLLTTIAIFFVLIFSELPILRQLGVFSILGLCFGFGFFFAMKNYLSRYFHVKPFYIRPVKSKALVAVSLVLLATGLVTPFLLKPDLSLQQLNYEGPGVKDLRAWVYTTGKSVSPLIEISKATGPEALKLAHERARFGESQQIDFENVARYLPEAEVQSGNLESWRNDLCGKGSKSADVQEFFEPFWKNVACDRLKIQDLQTAIPLYTSDLSANGKWVTVWFPKDQKETELVQKQFPKSESLMKILAQFSETLSHELRWIVPAAIAIAFIILFFYSISFVNSLLAIVPFFSGIGCYFLVCQIASLNVSFITVIGLIMVFGFSIDYGIFMVNLLRSGEFKEGSGVRTSITLASLTTMMGFAPLIFAHHPALRHLGQSLFLGSLGAYFGAICAVPALHRFFRERKKT